LIQQEPDASSFPNGGIRNTFEEVTLHGIQRPAFILELLYVFLRFYFLHGEALDYKTPLLRALQVMDDAATEVCKYFDKT
jgi:glutamine synthetase